MSAVKLHRSSYTTTSFMLPSVSRYLIFIVSYVKLVIITNRSIAPLSENILKHHLEDPIPKYKNAVELTDVLNRNNFHTFSSTEDKVVIYYEKKNRPSIKGCYVKRDRKVYPAGAVWHPFVQPFGYMRCHACTCLVSGGINEQKRAHKYILTLFPGPWGCTLNTTVSSESNSSHA